MKIRYKCPFCRSETTRFVKTDCLNYQVECSNCASRGPIYNKKVDAIKGWNYGDDSMISYYKKPRLLWPEETKKETDN